MADPRRHRLSSAPRRSASGFSLIELMVAVVLSMVVVLVIAQSYATFESQNRRTTGGGDAEDNGLSALQSLQSDLGMAGYGLVTTSGMACTTFNYYNGAMSPAAQTGVPIQPVQIIDGGNGPGSADTIIVTYSNSPGGAVPAGLTSNAANSSSAFTIQAPAGTLFNVGDLLLVSVPGSGEPCAQIQISAVSAVSAGLQITPGATGTPALSPPSGTDVFPSSGYGVIPQAYVFDMGSMARNEYEVNCNSLTLFNLMSGARPATACTNQSSFATGVAPIASDVVDLQAQYGVAQTGSQSVSCWVNAVDVTSDPQCPAGVGNWASPAATDVVRIKAIRVAVVARSRQMEKTAVTGQCTNASGEVNNGPCAWPDSVSNPAPVIDLSADPHWTQYRYQVYETIVPLRNVLWANL